jgi:hypothetical protein
MVGNSIAILRTDLFGIAINRFDASAETGGDTLLGIPLRGSDEQSLTFEFTGQVFFRQWWSLVRRYRFFTDQM